MNVILLAGENSSKDRNTIAASLSVHTAYVYCGKDRLHSYIRGLALEENQLYQLRICQERTGLEVSVLKGGKMAGNPGSVSELLSLIEPGEKYRIVIRDNSREAQSHLVQQFAYLGIPLEHMEVETEREIRDADRLKRFMDGVDGLREKAEETIRGMERLGAAGDPDTEGFRTQILAAMKKIRTAIGKTQNVELKIMAAGCKKTGKSTIINSMIGEELAPTSLELATPNNCIYKKSEDNLYHLEYRGVVTDYATAGELRRKVLEEFRKAERDMENGLAIPDMTLYYVTSRNNFDSYTVYDSPGPNLAGARGHRDAVERALRKADVILFVIDYTNYLTEEEVRYLDSIKELFDNLNKYYSLIFVVNKVDERYINEDRDKCVIRLVDFIRSRLVDLNAKYGSRVVMGTSARIYYDTLLVSSLPEFQGPMEAGDLRAALDDYCDAYGGGKRDITAPNFLYEQCRRYKRFEGITIGSFDDLRQESGMAGLLKYVQYIAREKAVKELVQSQVGIIDAEYAQIRNIFNFDELRRAMANNLEMIEQILRILKEFDDSIQSIFRQSISWEEMREGELEYLPSYRGGDSQAEAFEAGQLRDAMKSEIRQSFSSQDILNGMENAIAAYIRQSLMDLAGETLQKNGTLEDEGFLYRFEKKFKELVAQVDQMVYHYLNSQLEQFSGRANTDFDHVKEEVRVILDQRMVRAQEAARQCAQRLKKECDITFHIELPQFSFGFEEVSLRPVEMKEIPAASLQSKLLEEKTVIKRDTWWHRVRDFFGFGVQERQKTYLLQTKEDVDRYFDQFFGDTRKEIWYSITHSGIEDVIGDLARELNQRIDSFLQAFSEQVEQYNARCVATSGEIRNMLDDSGWYEKDNARLERHRQLLQQYEDTLARFDGQWKQIRGDSI